ncbi:MAG: hypothetical protein KAQ85_03675 [Thermodesulfovibrionia bacterium]|nr:hypothetical protein [Thermodesulfovibrionia bacterium]
MNLPIKISQREKNFLLIGMIVVFLIIMYRGVLWYRDFRFSAAEHIETKRITLERQLHKILKEDEIRNNLQAVSAELNNLEKGLLMGDKPPVVAAEIQRILKSIAKPLRIDIKSERALNPVENGLYISIPVEIGFIASTAQLKDMLYKIKTSPLILSVTTIKIRVTNVKNPEDVYITLVVKGLIKKAQTPETDKKEDKIAA